MHRFTTSRVQTYYTIRTGVCIDMADSSPTLEVEFSRQEDKIFAISGHLTTNRISHNIILLTQLTIFKCKLINILRISKVSNKHDKTGHYLNRNSLILFLLQIQELYLSKNLNKKIMHEGCGRSIINGFQIFAQLIHERYPCRDI